MADGLTLIGFEHSVYTRIVRMALIEIGMQADYVEVDPFGDDPKLDSYTPFGRVPVLLDRGFILTETAAILRYLVRVSGNDWFLPSTPQALARMDQVIGVVDAYFYVPFVRQVFSHGFYAPLMGEPFDRDQIAAGLKAGAPALRLLDTLAQEGMLLNGQAFTLADIYLAPMIDYLVRVPEGASAVAECSALAVWWARVSTRTSLVLTDPFSDQIRRD